MLQKDPPVSKEVLKEWQDTLDKYFPPNPNTTHLKIVWVPGDDWEVETSEGLVWQGVERFYLFEMLPEEFIDWYTLAELKDMPRPIVRYDSVLKEVTNGNRMVTRLQWDLYQETRHYAKPFWVIQGDNGGHQRFFTTFEKQQLELLGLPTDPPLPGTLPYAPFDKRVLNKVLEHDKLRQIGDQLMMLRETQKEKYKRHQADMEKKFRERIVAFVAEQVDPETARDIKRGIRDDAPIIDKDFYALEEQATERFIETGSLN